MKTISARVHKNPISQDRLKELLIYDEGTGIFTRAKKTGQFRKGVIAGSLKLDGYVYIMLDAKMYKGHRLAWLYVHGEYPMYEVDHIDGNKSNNVIANLRLATPSQNKQNIRKTQSNNKSGFLGVTQYHGRWRASITINRKHKHIGVFDTPQEAHEAYLTFKRSVHEYTTI